MDTAARDYYPPGDLRASDADRDLALSELSEALQAGRITADEFDERSVQVLRARTGKELTAPLADLPLVDRTRATRATAPEPANHLPAVRRIMGASAVAATVLSADAVVNALNPGPTLQQRELLKAIAARQGLPVPPGFPPSPGFDWAGTITPGAIAVLFVVLIIYLRVRLARADRP